MGDHGAGGSGGASRRDRLIHDLRDAGIGPLDGPLLDELEYALTLRPHEGVVPHFGAVVPPQGSRVDARGWAMQVVFDDPRRLRQLADGRTSFVVRTPDEPYLGVWERRTTESELVLLCAQTGARVVRLIDDALLQLLSGERLCVLDRTRWASRPTSVAHLRRVEGTPDVPAVPADVRRGLLDLAVHELGSVGVGAILVWLPDRDRTGCGETLGHGGPTPPLRVTDRRLDGAVANLLRQQDGAALISPEGELWWTGVELLAPPLSTRVRSTGGMRHRSAARFSRVRPDALVVVVSDDGPVSVYVAGRDVTASEPGVPPPP